MDEKSIREFSNLLFKSLLIIFIVLSCLFSTNACKHNDTPSDSQGEKTTTPDTTISTTDTIFEDSAILASSIIDYEMRLCEFNTSLQKSVESNDVRAWRYALVYLLMMHDLNCGLLYNNNENTLNFELPINQQDTNNVSSHQIFSLHARQYYSLDDEKINSITKKTIEAYNSYIDESKRMYNYLCPIYQTKPPKQYNKNMQSQIKDLQKAALELLQSSIENDKKYMLSFLSWVETYYENSKIKKKDEILLMCEQARNNLDSSVN